MAGTIHDLGEARERKTGRREVLSAKMRGARLVLTFREPVERLELTASLAEFWISTIENFLPALRAEEAAARATAGLPPKGKAVMRVVGRDGAR